MTEIIVEIQRFNEETGCPSDEEVESWVKFALSDHLDTLDRIELSLRLVEREESAELNQSYRNKEGPTNVLSFPFELPPGFPSEAGYRLLGDIVICAPVVKEEANRQQKPEKCHWAHLVIHGVLHLLGYDHQTEAEAEEMEAREVLLLSHFKIPNPYLDRASVNQ